MYKKIIAILMWYDSAWSYTLKNWIMRAKLTCLMLLLAFMQMGFAALAQRVSLTKKNAAITEVFRELRKQSGYDFVINKAQIKASKPVTINVKDGQLKDVLDACFENQPFTYAIENKMIVVIPKRHEDRVTEILKDVDVRGKVLDENGEPLQGASVKVKGGTLSTMTDMNGEFLLKAVQEDAVIVIAYLGYKSLELKAIPSMGIVRLTLATSELNEVTVSTGYFQTSKRLSVGNIAKVTANEIGNQPVVSPLLALQGRVAGLEITMPANATPGVAPQIRIRGNNSLRIGGKGTVDVSEDGNRPLYVVDGVPVMSNSIRTGFPDLSNGGYDPLSTINPNNIESIEILKDADATAVYGSRGANGVILITTKRSSNRAERTDVDISVYRGTGRIANKLELLNTEQYLEMRREGLDNAGVSVNDFDYDLKYWDPNSYTDWQDVLLGGTAGITDLQSIISGGNQNTSFRIGGGYHRETLILSPEFGYSRASAQASV
ncbi:MAG: SusC/RagA family TonB-linked outer membrane protein, partial [Pedobacter sp.]